MIPVANTRNEVNSRSPPLSYPAIAWTFEFVRPTSMAYRVYNKSGTIPTAVCRAHDLAQIPLNHGMDLQILKTHTTVGCVHNKNGDISQPYPNPTRP